MKAVSFGLILSLWLPLELLFELPGTVEAENSRWVMRPFLGV